VVAAVGAGWVTGAVVVVVVAADDAAVREGFGDESTAWEEGAGAVGLCDEVEVAPAGGAAFAAAVLDPEVAAELPVFVAVVACVPAGGAATGGNEVPAVVLPAGVFLVTSPAAGAFAAAVAVVVAPLAPLGDFGSAGAAASFAVRDLAAGVGVAVAATVLAGGVAGAFPV